MLTIRRFAKIMTGFFAGKPSGLPALSIPAAGILNGLLLSAMLCTAAADEPVDFQRQILPLLSDRCFVCHGPDEGSRQADLRLDQRDELLAHVVAGEPNGSELWERITARDEDQQMPPPDSRLSLTDDERELIRKWIDQGASWNRHWSLEPLPESVDVPEVVDNNWPGNELDRFVLARLESGGRSPSQPAPRWRWLRRVSLDLTGLPPTAADIEAFENDPSSDAFEKVVDRLLASPHFGEHMAVSWLDAARYADSYGYQSDLLSPTWPWRDWLVRAINRNLPYDQFLTWQLAGDLLPDATADQILATTFNRLHRMTNEGGSLEPEWRVENVCDRVNTFGAAMLGLTVECARCHDHKYDPVSQQDYYNLFAFFNSIDEWGVYHDSSRVPTPSLMFPDPQQQSAIDAAKAEYETALAAVAEYRQQHEAATNREAEPQDSVVRLQVQPVAWFPMDDLEDHKWLANQIRPDQIGNTSGKNELVPGRFGNAIRVTEDDACEFPYVETDLQPWEPFAISFWIYLPSGLQEGLVLHQTGGTDCGFFGTELSLEAGKLRWAMMRFWPGNALAVETSAPLPTDQWVHIVAGNRGTGSAGGMQLLVNGTSDNQVLRDNLTKRPDAPEEGFFMGARLRSIGIIGAGSMICGYSIVPCRGWTSVC